MKITWGKTFRLAGWLFSFRIGNNPWIKILGFTIKPDRRQ